jgi:glycosyltransferase involved in cell wall biosynthesis
VTVSPLVSIVIPCFNYGHFLGAAIESVLAQTHQPIEVIVVDDGSTDDTQAVARRYPVRVLSQPNSGICVAANAGFAAAKGEFVARLDADDCLAPTYVEETLAALRNHPEADLAYTECSYFGARTGTYSIEAHNPETLAERNYIHASALMRRTALLQVGGYNLNMSGGRYEDWDLWLAFAEAGSAGVLVPRPLLLYRQHAAPSRGTLRLNSWRMIQREVIMASRLQANHPHLMAAPRLLRRLSTLPRRLVRREVSPRYAALLIGFYGVMLVRVGFSLGRQHSASRVSLAHFVQHLQRDSR